jgi:23S rRNA (guanosine2251-2'-O)-methyltransferase
MKNKILKTKNSRLSYSLSTQKNYTPKLIQDLDFHKNQKSIVDAPIQSKRSNSKLAKFYDKSNLIKYKKTNLSQNFTTKKSQQNSSKKNLGIWLCGRHPILTILEKKRRQVFEILVTKNTMFELEEFLVKKSLIHLKSIVKLVENEKIESLVGKNQVHQGFALNCSNLPLKNQNELLEQLYKFSSDQKLPTLLLLDKISDPQNIGAIIRSSVGFGVNKIIFCEHSAPKESAAMVKASAGTIEMAELFTVTNLSNLIEKLKKINYWCVGLAGEGNKSIQSIKEFKNVALIIGSEGTGLRSLVKKNCDVLVKIEIDMQVESLNASVAAAIALWELTKK